MNAAAPLRILILGAHPDDAEFAAGGAAAWYRAHGHAVRMVSATNGAAGHQSLSAAELAEIRRAEAAASAAVIGAESSVWDFPDGELEAGLPLRRRVIREIRAWKPDLVLTHRTCDYHPDHRALGQAVNDASFMVRVPAVAPDSPALRTDPVVAYMNDHFTNPTPLRPDVLLNATPHRDTVLRMLAAHRSQFFDWLPYVSGIDPPPETDEAGLHAWLSEWYGEQTRWRAELFAAHFQGAVPELLEAFEISPYAGSCDEAQRRRLFPWIAE